MTHAIAQIFQESAHANSTHKKNVLSLRKQLLKCTGNAVAAQQFLSEIARCIRKVLPLKKGLQVAERTVHFFQNFLKACEDFQTEDGSLYNRMVEELLRELSNGFNAKDKNVRFRVCQIVGVLLNNISELDDDLFSTLCEKLLERTQDKEPMVRAQAARGLENFCDDDEVFKTIRQLLECDPSGDVRKAVLETVYWSKENISLFAKRCRDRDVNVRKVVYPTLCKLDGCLSNQDREVLLQGLYDRDNEIRQRCIRWVCLKLVPEHGILKLLHELDLSTDLPAHLLSCVLQTIDSKDILRQDICKAETWDNLTPVTAFYIRVCISHYLDNQMYDKVEETLPPLNHQVAVLQKHCALMIEGGDNDAFVQEQQFILGELLMIAEVEDFADELGRRQMLSFLRKFDRVHPI
ncbi:hypothetical protein HK102_010965 [Quaeritorhiza haematococci]|nr:hypothetical protein HK102_010965 [Quaeritorhiza haematococci]